MTDILLMYKAAMSPRSLYDIINDWQQRDEVANKEVVNEFQDFKEFLCDVYFNGGLEEFKNCMIQFSKWQGYTDEEIKERWPELF